MCFLPREGLITGRHHLVYGINCQDSLLSKTFQHHDYTYHIGVVADGCGEATRSETGAHLATSFAVSRIEYLLRQDMSPDHIPHLLFNNLLDHLRFITFGIERTANSPQETVSFIKEHLLFTLLGFYTTPEHTVIFALGDGVVLLNDELTIRDEKNYPNYISYHLVDPNFLDPDRSPLPQKFDLYQIPTKDLDRLAIGTDAWVHELGIFYSLFDEQLCKNVQRTMNQSSRKQHSFKDDASIIILERKEAPHESENR